jgi:peptidoglycan/LPS O-acetylase OafA/YrhL
MTVAEIPPIEGPLHALPAHPVPHRIPSLDGLRALAIILVLIGHCSATVPWDLPSPIGFIFGNGAMGVLIFFCISGFLITRLLINEKNRHGRISLVGFYIRRSFRILPAFLTFLSFIVALKIANFSTITTANLVSAGLFVTNYSPYSENWLVAHTWSLSIEEQFYLVWPLILVLFGMRRSLWIGIGLIFAMPFVRVATYAFMPDWRAHIPVMMHTRIDALMFGCVAAIAYEEAWFQRLYNLLCTLKLHLILPLFALLIAPFVRMRLRGAYDLPVGLSIDALAATLGMVWLIRNPHSSIGKWFNAKFICWIGVLSYSLYLWQQPFFSHDTIGWPSKFPINIVFVFVAAVGSYYLVEQPFLRLRAKIWR